ncbi:hypothetical protein ISN45_Aa04g020330 [Arabidopsis thaliana x Arabidopsis arenosa]|uniref:Uncharacterized protein n=1 Tax=Arabidopsis thaliana x Arabidopsis arenosa TaxID=1240361 RepID=A0A8T2AAA2_9BRAS|nr:hypothetical protein ISN45_Aa04g020330 [Arabidopsis thaliana x Arabidopsis arenosa]
MTFGYEWLLRTFLDVLSELVSLTLIMVPLMSYFHVKNSTNCFVFIGWLCSFVAINAMVNWNSIMDLLCRWKLIPWDGRLSHTLILLVAKDSQDPVRSSYGLERGADMFNAV